MNKQFLLEFFRCLAEIQHPNNQDAFYGLMMKKKQLKIAIINFGFNKKSGIEIVADNMIKLIDRTDNNNIYLLYINEFVKDYYIASDKIRKIVVKKMARTQILKTVWLLFLYPIITLFERIDITLVFSGTSNFSLSPFTKNVIYIHDLGELYVENKYDKKRMFYRRYISLAINKIFGDIFVVVSRATENAVFEKLKVQKDKIKLIYNGADLRINKVDKQKARTKVTRRYGLTSTCKILLTVGRIDPIGKNLIRLVEAIDILRKTEKDIHLFLVGESNFSNFYLVSNEIENKKLGRHITLTGYVGIEELSDFYNSAELLIFPSIHEGFGLPLLEAFQCQLPVACSDIDAFREVGGDAVVYFDPYESVDIANNVKILLNNEELKLEKNKKGKKRLLNFSWESSTKKLLDIFHFLGTRKGY